MKGILLIALQHHYYGKMAAALAATIRACSDIPIALICDRISLSDISESEKNLFQIIPINNEGHALRNKLCLFDLSPFDETLYLDVDMAWFGRDPLELFTDTDFNMKNYGSTILDKAENNSKAWANFGEISLVYGLGEKLNFHLSSEVIYFKKTERVKDLFEKAKQVFDNPKITFRQFAGYMPDELAFAIAMMQTDLYPQENFEPVFWRQTNKSNCYLPSLREKFHGFSMGGIRATDVEIQIYNNLVSAAYYKLGLVHPHKWVNKNRFLNNRKKI